jgi:hypothetical protein
VALRFSIGGRTTEQRHVEAAWHLLQRLAVTAFMSRP